MTYYNKDQDNEGKVLNNIIFFLWLLLGAAPQACDIYKDQDLLLIIFCILDSVYDTTPHWLVTMKVTYLV